MQAMKPKYIPSNNNYKKKYFKCNNCGFLCIKNVPQNLKQIKCDKCPNILTEISEREYQTRCFMYVNNNNQTNGNINIQNKLINNNLSNIGINTITNNNNVPLIMCH